MIHLDLVRDIFSKLPHQLQLCQKILQILKYRVTNGLQRCRVLWNPFPPFRHKLFCKIWQHHKHSYNSLGKRECAVIKQAQNLRQMAASWRTSPIWQHIGDILGNNYLLQKRHHLSSIYKQSCTKCRDYFMTFWTKLSNFRTGHSHLALGSLDLATWIEGILVIIVQSWQWVI